MITKKDAFESVATAIEYIKQLEAEINTRKSLMGFIANDLDIEGNRDNPVSLTREIRSGIGELQDANDYLAGEASKPIVWVRRTTKDDFKIKNMYPCDENGNKLPDCTLEGSLTLKAWMAIPGIEVRIWEPVEDPKLHPGSSITDGDYTVGCDFAQDRITTCIFKRVGFNYKLIDEHHFKKEASEG